MDVSSDDLMHNYSDVFLSLHVAAGSAAEFGVAELTKPLSKLALASKGHSSSCPPAAGASSYAAAAFSPNKGVFVKSASATQLSLLIPAPQPGNTSNSTDNRTRISL